MGIGIGNKARKVVWDVEEKIYHRTNFNSIRFKQENKCKKTCFSNPTSLSRLVEFSISYSTPLPKPIASVPLILSLILLLKPIVFVFITLLFSAATLQVWTQLLFPPSPFHY